MREIVRALLWIAFAATAAGAPLWLGPDGLPLPLTSHEEALEFLRHCSIAEVKKEKLGGTSGARKVAVERDGIRAHAVFRSSHRVYHNARWDDGKYTVFLRDSYLNEIAAYELSRLLGLDLVPPTIAYRMRSERGALQLWIEKAEPGFNPLDRSRQPPDPERWRKERERMRVFDELIENVDRNVGNMLIDSRGKVWWIDHTRSFGRNRKLQRPDVMERAERSLFIRLRETEPAQIAAAVSPHMSKVEVDALLERRRRLLEHFEKRIALLGEAAVLFDLD